MIACVLAIAGPAAFANASDQMTARVLVNGPILTAAATQVGSVPAGQPVTVQVWLTPRVSAAEQFAVAASTPGTASFHQYLSPKAYVARFGPTPSQAQNVSRWLTGGGLTDVKVAPGRDYVSGVGPARSVGPLFDVRLNRYRTTDTSTLFQAADRPASVPASIAPDVTGVTGLDDRRTAGADATTMRAASPVCSHYWAQHVHAIVPAFHGLKKGVLPICGYSARQLRSAYGATSAATGTGVTIALTEDEAPTAMASTLRIYAARNHLPAPKAGQYRQISAGRSSCATSISASRPLPQAQYEDEAEMDSEASYAMAPDAKQLMVIGTGCDEDSALLNADLAVLDGDGRHPSATIVSNSWQIPQGEVSASTLHAIDVRAAAEGVGMYFASGDAAGLTATASDPFVTAVGGTTLGIGAGGTKVFQTGWSLDTAEADHGQWDDLQGGSAAGGGTSDTYPQPRYQRNVVPASISHIRVGTKTVVGRAVPDLAADGDLTSGMLTGYTFSGKYVTAVNAGTSLATPLIAGLLADAQQGQTTSFGLINPLIYRLYRTAALLDVLPVDKHTPQQNRIAYTPPDSDDAAELNLFDYQSPRATSQVTTRGYDTMTGLGTPNGPRFISALRSESAGGCHHVR
nr:protease pro-enzyme activation domain-containing protein [Allobranchiibius huperziae]